MQVPFMRSYAERLVQICHKHGAHAMGGMSAFIPSRRYEEINKTAISQVTIDKEREVCKKISLPQFSLHILRAFRAFVYTC